MTSEAMAIPVIMLECKVCRKQILQEFVTIKGFKYHPECFSCAGCTKQIFASSTFVQADDPSTGGKANWHKDCYKQKCAPKCAICQGPIEGRYAILEGKNYHTGCMPGGRFTARAAPSANQADEDVALGSNLDRSKSVPAAEGSGRLSTSMQREQSLPAPRSAEGDLCAACRLPLIGEHVIVQGKGYHGACFVCAGCGQPVERGVPFVRAEDGYGKEGPWHKECYANKNRCFVCDQPIDGKYLNLEGKKLHNWCLLCAGCGKVVPAEEFLAAPDRAGEMKQWHEPCYMEQAAPACGACGKPIAYRDKYMVIGGKKLHHECFSCLGCRIPIGTGGYYEDYDREGNKGPWHVECHAKRGEGAPQDPTTRIVSVPLEEEKEEGPIENANVVR